MNKDGMIQFSELSMYVTNKVIVKSKELGHEQFPVSYKNGGEMVFVMP